ncbi:hypothetical protein [Halalkalibacter urbisdiaboli]|uniref:hypothetical protein n=1 Tax=Halalkalibacter urbisdiaboli TaxID=1960589 RepID=UPI0013FD3D90|nr:hypothetical protein [Halalkalibacter urbisdiaboli]
MNRSYSTTASSYQQDKQHIALLKRDGLDWDDLFPLSIRQTQFPTFFEQQQPSEKNKIH